MDLTFGYTYIRTDVVRKIKLIGNFLTMNRKLTHVYKTCNSLVNRHIQFSYALVFIKLVIV